MTGVNPFGPEDEWPENVSEDGYGPIITAGFESECAGDWDACDGTIYEGDQIRGKGGEWFHVGCEA